MKLNTLSVLLGALLLFCASATDSVFHLSKADSKVFIGEKIDNPGTTYKTQRIWLNNDNNDFYNDNCVNAVGYTYNKSNYIIEMGMIQNSYDAVKYYYADIPYELRSIHFLRYDGSNTLNDYYIESLSYGVCYFCNNNEYETGVVYGADAPLLSMVVEAYLTYGKSDANGATKSTITNLNDTWFKNTSASKNDLKNIKILDYSGYSKNGNSYEGLTKDTQYSVNEKWNTMLSQSGANQNSNGFFAALKNWFTNSSSVGYILIGGVAILTTAGVAIYLVIKKRRQI